MKNLKLPEEVNYLISKLNENGFEAYAVGGCVRDMILGKIPDDYDVTTNALPEETKKVFSDLKTIDTGIKHGTVTVIKNSFHIEVTTYRIDGEYKDNRRPESVTFSKKLADDLSRRDFTVNALAFNEKDGLKDFFGGLEDMKNKTIRCVGNPKKRFNEDALRILRAIRFSSHLGYTLEKDTAKAVAHYAYLLQNISKERILAEIKKLVCGKNAKNVLSEYQSVVKQIFPKLNSYSQNQYELALEMTAAACGDWALKLSALLFFLTPDDAYETLKALKSDNASAKRVKNILSCKNAPGICSEREALYSLNVYGEYIFDFLNLKLICSENKEDILNQIEVLKNAVKSQKPYKISHLDINGNDLVQNGIAKGADIGICLNKLLYAVIDGKLKNTKKDLLEYLKN